MTLVIRIPSVQLYVAQKSAAYLSNKLKTKVEVGGFSYRFFDKMSLDKVFIQDLNKDTLFYLGHLELKITDWFFIKKEKELHYLGIQDASVYLARPRKDSIWNYSFIEKAFGASKNKTNNSKIDKNSNDLSEFSIKEIQLKDIHFVYKDDWIGEGYDFKIGAFWLNVEQLNFEQKKLTIKDILVSKTIVSYETFKGGRPDSLKPKKWLDTTAFNPNHWMFNVKDLEIEDARFVLRDPDYPKGPKDLFDEWNMDIQSINLKAGDINIKDDTLTGQIRSMKAKERSGIEIKQIFADVKVSPKISECRNLYLETNRSVLGNYYAMHYERFPDFLNYIHKVKMEGRLVNSKVNTDDIAYFAPEMKVFDGMEVLMNGKGGGTVDRIYAKNTSIVNGSSSLFVTDFLMTQLPEIDSSVMWFKNSVLQTNGVELLRYFPQLAKTKNINYLALGAIKAPFDLLGKVNDFKVKSLIDSRIGKIDIEGQLSHVLDPIATYKGQLGMHDFEIGTLLNNNVLDKSTARVQFSGKGFDEHNFELQADGNIQKISIQNRELNNIDFKTTLAKQILDVDLKSEDKDANIELNGTLRQLYHAPIFTINAIVKDFNLKKFGITDEEVWLKTNLKTQFNNISGGDLMGKAVFNSLDLKKGTEHFSLDSIAIESSSKDNIQYLNLNTKRVALDLFGDFNLFELPNTFQYFLSKYLPGYFKKTQAISKSQNINFELNIDSSSNIFSFLNPEIRFPNGAKAKGSLNSGNNIMVLNTHIPSLYWEGIILDSVFVLGSGNKDAFEIIAGTETAGYGNNTFLNRLNVNATLREGKLNFLINTATPDEFGSASLRGSGSLLRDSINIEILPSNIFINNNYWYIPEGNSIVFSNNKLNLHNIEINSDNQHIYINKGKQAADHAHIELINLGFAPLSRLFSLDDVVSGGRINGTVDWNDILGSSKIYFDVATSNVLVQNEVLQSIKAIGNYDQRNNRLFLDTLSGISDKEGSLSVGGLWALGGKENNSVSGNIHFDNAKIIWLNPLLKEYVNQLNGRIDGNIIVSGSSDKLLTDGQIILKNASVRSPVLGEKYTIPNASISLTKDRIDLGKIEIKDMQNNSAYLTGSILHENLVHYFFKTHLQSPKIRVLNLTASDQQPYYGKVDAVVNANMDGWATDLKVQASVVPLENSSLIIPLDFSEDIGTYSFIKFKKPDQPLGNWLKRNTSSSSRYKYNIRIDAVVNNNLNTNIVLDPRTNDELNTRGNGSIVMEIPSDDDIRLNGNYVIESGYYNFTFRQMQVLNFNRKFNIQSGSAISWNGNLYDANLKIVGITAAKARLYDLISAEVNRLSLTSNELSDAKLAQMINVELNVAGSLKSPDVKFKIIPSENRSLGTYAYQKLERINNDEKALLNQVASLLLLSQFSPPEGFMNNTAAVSSGAINNVTDLVSSVASSQLTNLANRIFKVDDLHVGVSYKNYNLANNDISNPLGSIDYLNRNEAKLSVRKNFLKDRLLIDVGTVYDWGRPAQVGSGTYTTNIAGDFLVQYLIRKDGTVRFNVFRNSNYDALFQQNTSRQGIGISYRKSFENLWDFLGLKKQQSVKDSVDINTSPELPNQDTVSAKLFD
ncbi:MAG TPA: translocation/assembly module TamB domain-containing protein [Edaphocola sp.]|nr:translocation/assembly module TamB domain-containing protein [Edaphocola sp.]